MKEFRYEWNRDLWIEGLDNITSCKICLGSLSKYSMNETKEIALIGVVYEFLLVVVQVTQKIYSVLRVSDEKV